MSCHPLCHSNEDTEMGDPSKVICTWKTMDRPSDHSMMMTTIRLSGFLSQRIQKDGKILESPEDYHSGWSWCDLLFLKTIAKMKNGFDWIPFFFWKVVMGKFSPVRTKILRGTVRRRFVSYFFLGLSVFARFSLYGQMYATSTKKLLSATG